MVAVSNPYDCQVKMSNITTTGMRTLITSSLSPGLKNFFALLRALKLSSAPSTATIHLSLVATVAWKLRFGEPLQTKPLALRETRRDALCKEEAI